MTEQVPKSLLDVAGRPFVEHQVALLARHGVRDVIFCVGHLGDQIRTVLGDGSRWDMRFKYVFDGPTLLGTGGAVRRALPVAGPEFFVMYGDSYLDCDFAAIERAYTSSGADGLMTVFHNDNRWEASNVEFSAGQILRYDKVHRDTAMQYVDYGLGVLASSAFDPWATVDEPFDLAAVYQALIARGQLAGFEVSTRFYEIGSAAGLA